MNIMYQREETFLEMEKMCVDDLKKLLSDLANAESKAATQELLAIPNLLERVKQNQATPKAQYSNWRTLRFDI
jgi:hypothetical protein